MKILLGLGNPGLLYRHTRHNLGFQLVEELVRREGAKPVWRTRTLRAWEMEGLWLVQPMTWMNRSGLAVQVLRQRFPNLKPEDMLVACDDLHLPLGVLRLRARGSSGGHRGLEDVLRAWGTDAVPRLRMGIRPEEPIPSERYTAFVLSRFLPEERPLVDQMLSRAADAVLHWRDHGLSATMQKYNRKITNIQ